MSLKLQWTCRKKNPKAKELQMDVSITATCIDFRQKTALFMLL